MSNKTDWKDLGLRYIVTAVVAIIFATLSWLIPAQWVETNFNLWGGIAILVLVVILSAFIVFIMNFVLLKKRDDNSKSIFEKHNNLCKNCKMNNTSCSENVVALNNVVDRIKIHNTIIDFYEFATLERNVEANKTIYIYTSEFTLEESDTFKEIMKDNFAKNITYKYIIPKSYESLFKSKAKQWNKENPKVKKNSLLECYAIPDKYIFITVAVYDAENIITSEIIVKFSGGEEKVKIYPYVFKLVENQDKSTFINSLNQFMIDENKVNLWN